MDQTNTVIGARSHTLATGTLRAGAPMAEVAQLLRHADQATSSTYAAADVAAVSALARPWPEVRQ
jgi:site-specific recombinase XerD